jgi:hypothetical protein
MNTASLNIAIEVDDKGSIKIRKIGSEAEKSGRKGARGFDKMRQSLADLDQSSKLTLGNLKEISLATTAMAAATAAAITALIVKSINAASDLAEVTSKFGVVFDGQMGRAESWSKELVDGYAMSTREAKFYLSSVQDLLVPMGMAADQAGNMSNQVVRLSADLGSFNNLPTAQVMDDIQSALVGNYETMKKYGVVINAANVEANALRMGLAGTKDELTASHKAQAAYQLMVEGSAAAIGDMARTMDGYANQTKRYHAIIEDLTAGLGERLLPVAADVLSQLNDSLSGGKDGVDGLSEAISVQLLTALQWALEAVRFFHNGWLGIKLVGTAAVDLIAQSLVGLFEMMRNLAAPLDLIYQGMVKIGAVDVNPFDQVKESLQNFAWSSRDVTNQVLADIEKKNAAYDTIKGKIDGYIAKVKSAGDEEITAAGAAENLGDASAKAAAGVQDLGNNLEFTKAQLQQFAADGKDLGDDMWLKFAQGKEEADQRAVDSENQKILDIISAEETLADELAQMTMSSSAYQLQQLDEQYAKYAEFVEDKALLDDWYKEKKIEILAEEFEITRDLTQRMQDMQTQMVNATVNAWVRGEDTKVAVSRVAANMLAEMGSDYLNKAIPLLLEGLGTMAGAHIGSNVSKAQSGGKDWKEMLLQGGLYLGGAAAAIIAGRELGKNAFASGGWLSSHPWGGPIKDGGGYKDDVFLGTSHNGAVSNYGMRDEYVINPYSTAKYFHLIEAINQDRLYADGGPVTDPYGLAERTNGTGFETFVMTWAKTKNYQKAIATAIAYYAGAFSGAVAGKELGPKLLPYKNGGQVAERDFGFGGLTDWLDPFDISDKVKPGSRWDPGHPLGPLGPFFDISGEMEKIPLDFSDIYTWADQVPPWLDAGMISTSVETLNKMLVPFFTDIATPGKSPDYSGHLKQMVTDVLYESAQTAIERAMDPLDIFHNGGMFPDEGLFLGQSGEGMLSRRGVSAVGGSAGVERANSGLPPISSELEEKLDELIMIGLHQADQLETISKKHKKWDALGMPTRAV